MKCNNCGFDNLEGSKFCNQCGTKLYMDLTEFMQSIDILPKKIALDSTYLNELENIFKQYQTDLERVDWIDVQIDKSVVKKICEIIIDAIKHQHNGNLIESINIVKTLFENNDISKNLFSCYLREESPNNFTKQLYRGRVGENIFQLSEIFHVPFNKRQYVATERYSIPGYPCLYLSGSIYGSWLELNKPNINNFFISRYEVDKTLKVLDLSLLPRDVLSCNLGDGSEYIESYIKGQPIDSNEVIKKYIYTWPIICACSFVITEQNRLFKSEYIFPQLLLQVIKNLSVESNKTPFDGIKYFSVKCDYNANVRPCPIYTNYVFISDNYPLYEDASKNQYSKNLIQKFKVTPPANAYTCMLLNPWGQKTLSLQDTSLQNTSKVLLESTLRNKAYIEIIQNHPVQYEGTNFYELEKLLLTIPAEKLDD